MTDGSSAPTERGHGFFTKTEKEYLRGETEYTGSSKRGKHERIRTHLQNTFADFALAMQYVDQRDREQVLDDRFHRDDGLPVFLRGETVTLGPPECRWDLIETITDPPHVHTGGLKSTQASVILLLYDYFVGWEDLSIDAFASVLEDFVAAGIQDAFGKHDTIVDATVDLSIKEVELDPDFLLDRFNSGYDNVTDQKVEWLFQVRALGFQDQLNYRRATR